MLVTRAEKSPKISMLVSKSQAILHGVCKKSYQIQDFLRPGKRQKHTKVGSSDFFVENLGYNSIAVNLLLPCCMWGWGYKSAHYSQAKLVIP